MFTVFAITTGEWENTLRINIYGCTTFARETGYDVYDCDKERAMGYMAVLYFVATVVIGGLILPAVVTGVIAISFDKAWEKCNTERELSEMLDSLIEDMGESVGQSVK